ncbi:3' terminal RNA ribose 2'-O-methyltransferase Hen1 [Pararhizobium sp. BT-229]|uniref:3' terminal RNA ribose 2'-O-methyltransferase Hen1 n=1 Tax=Pararhizobium sp. BT-229 TaxID=2986923 RepID=UPI0021F6F137|nr:3' terminal RNA ribose 2'-O-methyltransferase Hen1 [Pararhizobium sp. BT-229]MCV9964947.1 3' terminal RNA ribose 2'-O-methyltransferase Hen1 [Pararhizobium sp. BT-229]
MFLSLSVSGEHAPDLGFVLYKHPDRVFEKSNSKARVTGFFPENRDDHAEFCLAVEVDPVERVRGVNWDRGIASYVEPMPFLAASHMSQAISQALGSALNGTLASKDPVIDARVKAAGVKPWPLTIKVGPVRCSPFMIERLFVELGWKVEIESHALDVPGVDHDDDRPLHVFTLTGEATVSAALSQLYVLLPVLDPNRHYFYDESEARKLFDKGGDWLRNHSDKGLIISRYLSKSRELRDYAHQLFGSFQEKKGTEELIAEIEEEMRDWEDPDDNSPHRQRHTRIIRDISAWSARKVIDLGCGEGRLLERLVVLAPDMRVVGIEPSVREIDRARKRMSNNPGRTLDPRVELVHGSASYGDERFKDFDAAILSEVIEHVDPDRLPNLARSVFGIMAPRRVIVTTPNGDYNRVFALRPGEFRHDDHRFEWTLEECREWVSNVAATYGYDAEITPVGGRSADADESYGEISHYIVFTKKDA